MNLQVVTPKSDTPVYCHLALNNNGEVELYANGVEILAVMPNGKICIGNWNSKALKAMGFVINDKDEVVCE